MEVTSSFPSRSRKRQTELTPETFAQLLNWLAPDPDRAGEKYEQIRRGLIKIFRCRGSSIPEELADETINRVAGKLAEIVASYVGEPGSYFYAVADKIYLEYSRTASAQLRPLPGEVAENKPSSEEMELKYECLEDCLGRLPAHSREIIHLYYGHSGGGREKIARRKQMAEHLGIGTNILWLKAHRIRQSLKKCVRQCFQSRDNIPA
jgi:DNA-directed RNA polymerase specialized sigma24 family protein